MQDKLKTLFEKINLDEEYYHYFNDATLDKIVISKKNKTCCFKLTLKDMLPLDFYLIFLNLLKDSFLDKDKIEEVSISFNYENINYDYLIDYYKLSIENLNTKASKIFIDNAVILEDNKIKIEVLNKVEESKLKKYIDKIKDNMESFGFKNDIEIFINNEKNEEIKKEIEETKEVKVEIKKEESNVLYGTDFKNKTNYEIKNITFEDNNVVVECFIFGVDLFESSRSNFKILTLKISDYTDSIYCKVFSKDPLEFADLTSKLKPGMWVKILGYAKNDQYSKDLVLNARSIISIPSKDESITDDAEEKRVELHAHTFMSQMDGVVSASDLVNRAYKYGMPAIAITDKNSVQAFPETANTIKGINKNNDRKIKPIYGVELSVVDDEIDVVYGDSDELIKGTTYVVFDTETTGFNATSGDTLIEIGAVKIKDGKIIDRFDELINPGRDIPPSITSFTHITNKMVKDARNEEEVTKTFKEWIEDLPVVAHNAKFDRSFMISAYSKYNLGTFDNVTIDTLQLSRILNPEERRHNLSIVTKRYEVTFDEESHHRADYDAEATALVFDKMLNRLSARGIKKINDLKTLMKMEDIFKFGNMYHITLLAKNEVGIRNLYRLISYANTKYLYKTPRILKSEVTKLREGLLIGSACSNGEIFTRARSVSDDELRDIMGYYDYIEVQPLDNYDFLLQLGEFNNEDELKKHVEKIIKVARDNNKLVVATSDSHILDAKDKIYREIIINQKVPGGGLHPLKKKKITNIPTFHFRTTTEMLEAFNFLDEDVKKEIVITNTNKIADMIEEFKIIKNEKEPYTPIFEGSADEVREMVNKRAHEVYGDKLPDVIEARIKQELDSIIGNGFDIIYLIAQKLVKKSNDDGYLVGSRGSVGSSFAATMMGITEVNPLPAHYVCPKCKKSIFEIDGKSLGSEYSSGYDLPDRVCECGTKMKKEGQDMPFATFLGFNGDKVPDIDLNFSGDYQSKAHDYTKVLFGEDYVFRAGTIGTVAEKTAFGFVKGYLEDTGKTMRSAEIERLAMGCIGVKRTTGQHPGGIVVIPNYMNVFDFTPYQYPADDNSNSWYTTHFDFHAIHDYVLKLDILGHDDPTVLRMLQDISGLNMYDIPFDDKDVLSLFSGPEVLGVTKEQIMCDTGTLGIPEFGTSFVIEMLKETKPSTFAELVKVSGLSHGTDVWLGNAQDLIKNQICDFKDVIGCRDDIMVYLMYAGLEPLNAFKIMEVVRKKGKFLSPEMIEQMKEKNVPEWYIESCDKIKYMFPKAHATAYVMMGLRVAWFKVHHPIMYYSAYFSIRTADYDIDAMIKGYDAIKERIIELRNKNYDITNKESNILDVLQVALEMTARGFKFSNIDLNKSDGTKFIIDEDKKTLIPPFRALDGLGDTVANKIVEERNKQPFFSIEDLQQRGKVSQTLIDKMRVMGILNDMPETSQLSLF
ncbi:MAG TPA: PolC-type DNA polymerase III [Bacilli bacterium]|nr:PolC-type DNA polymerase III [Bacilli bacterium]